MCACVWLCVCLSLGFAKLFLRHINAFPICFPKICKFAAKMPGVHSKLVNEAPAYALPWRSRLSGIAVGKCLVCSPCVGINAPERAAKELHFDAWVSVDQFELRAELKDILVELCGSDTEVHAGPSAGDLMQVEAENLNQDSDGLVSGVLELLLGSMRYKHVDVDFVRFAFMGFLACEALSYN